MGDSGDIFHAIADGQRRRVLDLLRGGERTVSGLLKEFSISQPALSQHLRVLREAGLVAQRAEGRHRVYRVEPRRLAEVYDWLTHFEEFWSERFVALRSYLEAAADEEDGR